MAKARAQSHSGSAAASLRSAGGVPPKNYCFNADMPVRLVWPKGDAGAMVFAPLPAPHHADPANRSECSRSGMGEGAQSDWIVMVRSAKMVGRGMFSWNLHHPADRESPMRLANPYILLEKFAQDMYKQNTESTVRWWRYNKLVQKDGNKPTLKRPDVAVYVIGGLIANAGKAVMGTKEHPLPAGFNQGDPLHVAELSFAVGARLLRLLDIPKPEYAGKLPVEGGDDPSMYFKHGNIVPQFVPGKGFRGGRILYIVDIKHKKMPESYIPVSTCSLPRKETSRVQALGYEAAILPGYALAPGKKPFTSDLSLEVSTSLLRRMEYLLPQADTPLATDALLRFAPVEQQAYWTAVAFSDAPELISRAWANNPELMTDQVKAVLQQRTTALMPNASANGDGVDAHEIDNPDVEYQEGGDTVIDDLAEVQGTFDDVVDGQAPEDDDGLVDPAATADMDPDEFHTVVDDATDDGLEDPAAGEELAEASIDGEEMGDGEPYEPEVLDDGAAELGDMEPIPDIPDLDAGADEQDPEPEAPPARAVTRPTVAKTAPAKAAPARAATKPATAPPVAPGRNTAAYNAAIAKAKQATAAPAAAAKKSTPAKGRTAGGK